MRWVILSISPVASSVFSCAAMFFCNSGVGSVWISLYVAVS